MNLTAVISIAGSIIVAALSCISVCIESKNRILRRRLRLALQDCQAFYRLEQKYCGRIVALTPNELTSVAAIQRAVRKQVRDAGRTTPSGLATPQQLQQELQRL